jgi:hypothetical protein
VMILRSSWWLQFILGKSGGREFEQRRAAVGEGEEHWRSGWVSYYRGNLSGDQRRVTTSHSDAVEILGHVAPSRETAVAGELIQIRRGECGTVAGIVYWPELSTTTIFM